jgi:RNA polymerase sigma factor (sigma-70 family)
LAEPEIEVAQPLEDLLALDAALAKLKQVNAPAAQLVQLRYFAGLTSADAAEILNISSRTADRRWAYAKAWLHQEIEESRGSS